MSILSALDHVGRSWQFRMVARSFAVLFLASTIIHGAARNVELSGDQAAANYLPGRMASLVGLAADDIKVSGLTHHDGQALLNALGKSDLIQCGYSASSA